MYAFFQADGAQAPKDEDEELLKDVLRAADEKLDAANKEFVSILYRGYSFDSVC
jgi:hypothetical protein